jgi:hypothetical protein
MVILVAVMIFLATVFMWPDSIYRMKGDLVVVRKMTGFMFGMLLLILLYNIL